MPVPISVRILDISLSGALVESSQPAKEGRRGRLTVDLGGVPILAGVEIRRVSRSRAGYHVGVMFVALSDEQRQVISRFTER